MKDKYLGHDSSLVYEIYLGRETAWQLEGCHAPGLVVGKDEESSQLLIFIESTVRMRG